MKKYTLSVLLFLLFHTLIFAQTNIIDLLIKDASIIDVNSGKIVDNQVVAVRNGEIIDVGSASKLAK